MIRLVFYGKLWFSGQPDKVLTPHNTKYIIIAMSDSRNTLIQPPSNPRFMFDFHNHLQDPRLRPHLTSVITAALAAGVHGCCCSSTSPADWPDVAHITSLHPRFTIIPAFGIHPWYLAPLPTDWPEHLEALLVTHPHAAVGESGLCGVNRLHPPDLQLTILRQQLTIAARYQRPVILHGARAWGHLLAAVKPFAHRIPALIAHSFGGSADILRQWLQLGGFVSFSG
ncbi:MAG: hypothetical protein GX230_01950, partial [Lentisphaerae bacterium]|nr:hypothetical protein [Lentisphaerota bacterium]